MKEESQKMTEEQKEGIGFTKKVDEKGL